MNSSIMYHILVPLLATAIFLPLIGNAKFGAILSLGRRAISRGASMARNGREITGFLIVCSWKWVYQFREYF